jgi:hypothetical protein
MDGYVFDGDEQSSSKKVLEQGGLETSEQAFMQGYSDDETIEECAECGSAVEDESKNVKEVGGESYLFCSNSCAEEFKESIR